ncbi:hexose transport-related protein [Vararia minispora EC-137]|uniref:Hexose transport-related protein n=1 Tax=Vararia minispora EC-137 TaxID=1314806 RepID=A0ACB8QPK6_9AGAM|nr:hexose transport-related protein [Vararia minispora EC-137]
MNQSEVSALALRREKLARGRRTGVEGLVTNPRLLWIALVAALGGLNYGYEQGSYAQVLVMPSFTNDPRFSRIATDSSFKGWTVSVLPLGGWLGSLVNGYFVGKFGRRWAISAASFVCTLGGALTTGAANPDYLFAGRFFIGFSVGMMSTAVPTFLSELAPTELRGTTAGLFQFAVCLGIMISYWIGYGTNFISATSSVSWRIPLAVQCLPALLLMFGVWLIPESPRHLVNIGQEERARAVLAYIRRTGPDDELMNIELTEIKAEAIFGEAERYPHLVNRGPWSDVQIEFLEITTLFSSWDTFKRTATGGLTMFFQQWTGIDAIVNYAPTIFTSIGLTGNTTSLLASGVVGMLFVLSVLPAVQLIDKVGRRTLMLAGTAGMLLTLILVAALDASFGTRWDAHRAASWFTAACIWAYIGCFGFSWGPTSWCLIAEIFPLSLRGPGVALSASSNWMNNFVVSYTVPIMLTHITWRTYIVFICTLALGGLWVLFFLPETRGKSLEEMDLVFRSHTGSADVERMERIAREIGLRRYTVASDDEPEKDAADGTEKV